ncbi:serine--tRNA ligase [Methanohalophilus halophilus]|uniref:Type-2 serine--tRNA ligase n=1 Tax=Methanohalophilus halophilus TaxID=2177 RepID=A0A1L3Q2P6_9EURY|nr:serine--tRNA ligase [Methanohalophilus halophilus]APH39137.1 serine--tRNA ligase [Methanohalophilus halophilus]RNI09806.1 serine--tRNA ligase [Methanohalophilus halophilus]SDW57833.1 seryl-tRNA synthetase [Methanohalophilus halophilus]
MDLEFRLKAAFKTSGDPAPAVDAIQEFLEEEAPKVLAKGAPEGEEAKIKSWNVRDNRIDIEIVSGRYVRSHDAIIRLRKPLAGKIGKEYHLGIRGIDVDEFVIKMASEKSVGDLKIPHVSSMDYDGEYITLNLDVGQAELENRVPDRILTLMEDKIREKVYGGKTEHWNLLWQSEKKAHPFEKDPTQEMLEKGWIKRGASRGQWIHGPQSTKLFRTFEKIVLEELLEPLGYQEMIFPKLVPWDVWKKSGHAKGVYPEIYYVCPPKTRDPEYWEEVADHYKVTKEVPTELIKEKIGDPIGGLCYAQCPPFWMYLQGETIPTESFPLKVFDRSGTSHRYESGGIHGMERVDEFHRIEIVWLGTKEQVVKASEELHERYMHIFNEILDLEWRKAWVTPWFMAQEGLAGVSDEQSAGTTDYEAPLPYRGDDGEWLEFQNVSVNGDKYPSGFNVKSQSGDELWSGCSGVGLERWTSAFLAQKGLDPENWPEEFRKRFGEMPEGIKFF